MCQIIQTYIHKSKVQTIKFSFDFSAGKKGKIQGKPNLINSMRNFGCKSCQLTQSFNKRIVLKG